MGTRRPLHERDAFSTAAAEQRARAYRWTAPAAALVIHYKYGSVLVPHRSNYASVLNAAEYWGVDPAEISADATVTVPTQDAGPVVVPREFAKLRRYGHE